jgi:hypothetical protein
MSTAVSDYYVDPWVRRRIREYCGHAATQPTCVYLSMVRSHDDGWDRARRLPVEALDGLLREGADVARSMWDHANLLIHLDLDYQNVDHVDEPYRHPEQMFEKLEPLYRATVGVLRRFGLQLLAMMTGRGYHFTGRVPLDSSAVDRLAAIAFETPRWLSTVGERQPEWINADLSARHARAYVGVGLLVEFLAHQISRRAQRRVRIPIVLNGTIVGTGREGRECLSIDLSYAGDPLDARHVRVAFGTYQKHLGPASLDRTAPLAPFAAVPRYRESQPDLLVRERTLPHAVRIARERPVVIPNVAAGVHRVLDAYVGSRLARFHRDFYTAPGLVGQDFGTLLDTRRVRAMPDCVLGPLLEPNDRLLQPAVIQHVTRALMGEGFSARAIAGLIASRYGADFNWGRRWFWLDANTRAEFDVRVFAGMLETGLDGALDFNCRSAQEKALCPGTPCTWDLRISRHQLLWGGDA